MIRIQEEDIDVGEVLRSVAHNRAGAVVSFIGAVREEEGLAALHYEAYDEMAAIKLEELRAEAIKKFELIEASIIHRKGRLAVGEKVVMVACSAPHRGEAHQACEWLVAELKKTVPIWKEKA